MCDAHLNNGPLTCTRTTPHDAPRGCTYTATHGADLSGEVGSDDE